MLNIKRGWLALCLLTAVFFTSTATYVYFFNVNDHSEWISEQIKKTTGYDVRFELLEYQWADNKRFSFTGVSLYQQQQRVAFIDNVELEVDKLNLWQRELAFKSIHIDGVDINIDGPLDLQQAALQSDHDDVIEDKKGVSEQQVGWNKLNIATLDITGLNIDLRNKGKRLLLKQAHLTSHDLLVINNQQLQTVPTQVDLMATFSTLQLNSTDHSAEISDFSLTTNANLAKRHALLSMRAADINSSHASLPPIMLNDLQLELQFAEQKLSLTHFFVNAFSGALAVTADAYLGVELLPKPAIKVNEIQLLSLMAKDMQLVIPDIPEKKSSVSNAAIIPKLPVASLSIIDANLQNISIVSEAKKFPLTLKKAHMKLQDWQVINNGQLIDPTQHESETGQMMLTFEYLRWKSSAIEHFSMLSRFGEANEGLDTLSQLQ